VNSDLKNINADLLKRYYDGRMSGAEKNALEQMALDDPFLKDAMDGFEANPGSFDAFYKNHAARHQKFSVGYFIVGGLLTVGLVASLIISTLSGPEQPGQGAMITPADSALITREVDVIPVAIDSLQVIAEADEVNAEEIVTNKTGIQKTITYPDVEGERPIVIEEDVVVDDAYAIADERNFNLAAYVPATYLSDLFVVDYRRIKRENQLELIRYTKYELTGTSAEFENELTNENDLVEKEVEVPYFEYLGKSMERFAAGDYKKALTNYNVILEQYKEDLNALFYGGLCYYNLQKYDKALHYFDLILTQQLNAFKEEAAWYKAKSLIKLERRSEAIRVLEDIIAGGGFYSKDAIDLKKRL
jgi:hypothetical protein